MILDKLEMIGFKDYGEFINNNYRLLFGSTKILPATSSSKFEFPANILSLFESGEPVDIGYLPEIGFFIQKSSATEGASFFKQTLDDSVKPPEQEWFSLSKDFAFVPIGISGVRSKLFECVSKFAIENLSASDKTSRIPLKRKLEISVRRSRSKEFIVIKMDFSGTLVGNMDIVKNNSVLEIPISMETKNFLTSILKFRNKLERTFDEITEQYTFNNELGSGTEEFFYNIETDCFEDIAVSGEAVFTGVMIESKNFVQSAKENTFIFRERELFSSSPTIAECNLDSDKALLADNKLPFEIVHHDDSLEEVLLDKKVGYDLTNKARDFLQFIKEKFIVLFVFK